jgi:hypothetical protein
MGPRILIDDGRTESRVALAAMLGLAGGMGWDVPAMRRPIAPARFAWTERHHDGKPWRGEKTLAERKRKRAKKAARKRRRGY